MRIDISDGWKCVDGAFCDADGEYEAVDLPLDLLRRRNRNYKVTFGKYGSYYDSVSAVFGRNLPAFGKGDRVVLEVEGVCQFADVIINGALIAHVGGSGKHFVDITGSIKPLVSNLLQLNVWAPQMAGRYVGAGISGGVRLHVYSHPVSFLPDGVFVSTKFEDGKAKLTVHSQIGSTGAGKYVLQATVFNARGKKTVRKKRKIKLKPIEHNNCELNLKLNRYYTWTVDDPYLYTVKLELLDEGNNVLDETESVFGITSYGLSSARGLVVCGRGVKLKGAVMLHDNGILGAESTLAAEEYKLSRIKQIGYNAVRYVGCPTEACLNALDKVGLMAYVDLFDVLEQGSFPYDGHIEFHEKAEYDCVRYCEQLRKHPSVVLYGICGDAAETYGRGLGYDLIAHLVSIVRGCDGTRPIVVNATERVPLSDELSAAGIKANKTDGASAISLGRQKDLFGKLTENAFACGDIAGYAYLYPRYASDKTDYPDRLILGTAAYQSRSFEAFDECEKNNNVIGEFLYCGADGLGEPLGVYEGPGLPPHACICGDLGLTYDFKPQAYYHAIMLGNRSESLITVSDPEAIDNSSDKAGHAVKRAHRVWNWPQNYGKPMEIRVFSGGEVVALYRDGRLIGRKLAGRVNKHIATFKTEFYPGRIEAISYHKGRECSRAYLESSTAPRAVKLTSARKSGYAGELLFVEINVVDKEGRPVPYASREIEVSVTGSGSLYALGNSDVAYTGVTDGNTVCQVYEGRALAVIKTNGGDDGKITVKVVGDGMLSGKISLRVKE